MKKLSIIIAVLCLCAMLCSCDDSGTQEVTVNFGNSAVYSQEDMEAAVEVIKAKFNSWEGHTLYTIEYKGDEVSAENLEYCNSLGDASEFTESIVFESSFRTPKHASGGFNEDEVYTGWSWYLARQAGGEWQLLTYGYA